MTENENIKVTNAEISFNFEISSKYSNLTNLQAKVHPVGHLHFHSGVPFLNFGSPTFGNKLIKIEK